MARWELVLDPDDGSALPLFLRIARRIAEDIRGGRLRPGDALPGSRELAGALGCHRNTVLAALAELEAEGWTEARPRQGTFISRELPERPPRGFTQLRVARGGPRSFAGATAFSVAPSRHPNRLLAHGPGVLPLGGGIPDVSLMPLELLARGYRRALGRSRRLLDYGDARGERTLRAALAEMLSSRRGVACGADEVLVTRGSQMALDLLGRVLLQPGDAVGVEALGYRPAWTALRRAGGELVPLAVDEGGLDCAALERTLATRTLRAVYVTPHHQYPTTRTLAAGRRLRLLQLARRHGFAILEDDYDHEFHYDGRPVLPLASADPHGAVVYVGTLSKLLAPGLRLGFVCAPKNLIERLAEERSSIDRQGDHALERAVAELFEDGHVQRHARRARKAYAARRDVMCAALSERLRGAVRFQVPAGGIALWLEVAPDVDPDAWAERAAALGVGVHPGRRFDFHDRAIPFLRTGYGAVDVPVLRKAIDLLARALPARPRRRRPRG